MNTLIISLIIGFAIGLSLGLLGGGGSILTVPALVYLIGQTPQVAVTTSLAVVGANSIVGAYFHRTQGTLNWRVALIFGGTGMGVSYLAASLSKHFSDDVLMVAFAALMLVVGLMLVLHKVGEQEDETIQAPLWKMLISGAIIGLLTGILGVGGGFLIVPALVMLVGLPFHTAVGTSLVIIAMNSAAGLLGHLTGEAIDFTLILTFVIAGLGGTFAGAQLGNHMESGQLRKAFAAFVIVLAVFLLIDNVPKLFM